LRLQHVTNVLAKQLSIVEVSSKIATAVDESLSKQQKALFLRQQLAAINAELQRLEPGNTDLHGTGNGQEDEDELELLIRRVDTLPAGSEVRRVASSEARRLKRIPPQNAEHGVVRNYVRRFIFLSHSYPDMLLQLEWLTSLPWAPTTASAETLTRSDFLANSQSQLDSDHYGLEKVKRRLMEYLAVVRLRALIAQEAEVEQAKAQEITLKKAIDEPGAGMNEAENQNENASMALIKAGEIPAPPRVLVPASPQSQSLLRAKAIKAPILL
jgi:ATP-dependent Lon protease